MTQTTEDLTGISFTDHDGRAFDDLKGLGTHILEDALAIKIVFQSSAKQPVVNHDELLPIEVQSPPDFSGDYVFLGKETKPDEVTVFRFQTVS